MTDSKGDTSKVLMFRNANFKDFNALSGNYFGKIPWEKEKDVLKLEIYSVEAESFGDLSHYPSIQNQEFEIEHSMASESGRTFLQFSVNPFRLNRATGKMERIISFILKVDGKDKMEEITSLTGEKKSLQSSSLLASGSWYKIRTAESGIYKLSYNDLVQIGISNPANTRVYGWGGTRLPENATEGTQDELLPVQTFMEKGTDGIFNQGDYLLFYAAGPVSWKFNSSANRFGHDKNNYSDFGYYFLSSEMGPAIHPGDEILSSDPVYFSENYDYRDFYEKDIFNPILSGKEWLGEKFDLTTQQEFSFNVPGIITSEEVSLETMLLSRAKDAASFYVYMNNKILDTVSIRKTSIGDYTATYAYTSNEIYSEKLNSENITVKLKYNKPDPTAEGILDYLNINARALTELKEDQLLFRDSRSVSPGNVTNFKVGNANNNTRIWNVNDIHNIKNIPFQLSNGIAEFNIQTSELIEFVAFNSKGDFPVPEYSGENLGLIENQDLHNIGYPDLIIITHPGFRTEAERLAEYRLQNNGFQYYVTDVDHIYNDFSSGRPDVTAIRNFLRHHYQETAGNEDLQAKYLLLFGDGSFEFKNAGAEEDNYVPTYQSDNSLSPTFSYVSDDYFGILDDGESMYSGLLDIGIGRLPVKSLSEAELMVDKIIAYESPDRMGDWRNSICFIGDDEDYNIHFTQADELAEYVKSYYPSFNISKIYLDAFTQETTSKGDRYPGVNQSINEQVSKGALIINYTGHGGTKGLAHERILDLNDIATWENKDRLPLFMTATCEFSSYDEPDIVSAGEEVILNPNGGGIALLTTTRLVYSGPNHVLNERFYEIVFDKDEEGNNYCLGDIMKYSKNNAGFGVNKRNFTLLGDPAMRLSYPVHKVVTDSINSIPVDQFSDTVKAFSKVKFSGHVSDGNGTLLSDFNGFVYPIIFDKPLTQRTLGNDGGPTKTFKSRKNVIYKGKVSVKNGRFSFQFIIPKDINYSLGFGRVSYYATDSSIDAAGADESFIVGGSSENFEEDNMGPELKVFMNNSYFKEGGITSENPILYVQVYDENGINTTGNGIGHDITAVLNDDRQNSYLLNDYYQADLDSYSSGVIEYPLFNLDEGSYTVDVKVWDIYNNSSEESTGFIVLRSNDLVLENLQNFPNPFSSFTEISFEHNKSNTNFDITLDIFSMEGNLIKSIKTKQFSTGFRSEPIVWNAESDNSFHVRQGMYIYRIRVKASDGMESEKSGRMILIR